MRIALSGTPGTGKTTVTHLLQKEGYVVIELQKLAEEHGFFNGMDPVRQSKLLDMSAVDRYIKKQVPMDPLIFLEGLAAHLLTNIEKVVLLRCHPQVLKQRLQQKGWSPKKIQENIEAEVLDIILCETIQIHVEQNIFEIDTTSKTGKETVNAIQDLIRSNFKANKKYKIGQIDWSEEILDKL
ncbi:MAG: adenylate kinase family protein [Methanobacteriota archaeon]